MLPRRETIIAIVENTITYRNGALEDIIVMTELLKEVRGDTREMLPEQFIVARDGNNVVGCIRIKNIGDQCLELASLAVVLQYRGRGVGTELVRRLLTKNPTRPIYLICLKERTGFYSRVNFKIADKTQLPKPLNDEYKRVAKKISSEVEVMILA